MPPTLTSIRRRAADNTLEVEHILEAASLRISGLSELLTEFINTEDWSDSNHLPDGTHVVPLARWARVGAAYCRDGFSGLKALLSKPGYESFVLALLEKIHSTEAVDAALNFFSEQIKSPEDDPHLAREIASSLNQILCFKPEVEIAPATREQIRSFTTALIRLGSDQLERAVPVLLLRAVGDENSIRLLDDLPPFTDPWSATISTTRRAIRKRLKSTK